MLSKLSKQTKLVILFTVICIAVTVFLTMNTVKYNNEDKVTVDAVITDIEKVINTGSGSNRSVEYEIYVDYEYNGQKYDNRLYSTVSKSQASKLAIGDIQTVEIYLNNPSEFAQNTSTNVIFYAGFSIILLFLSIKKVKSDLQGPSDQETQNEA